MMPKKSLAEYLAQGFQEMVVVNTSLVLHLLEINLPTITRKVSNIN